MALETVEKVREFLKKNLTSDADTLSSAEFRLTTSTLLAYLEIQEKRFNMAIKTVIQFMTDKDGEDEPAAAAGATPPKSAAPAQPGAASSVEFEEGDEMTEEELRAAAANPDVKSVPFPAGVQWKADAPTAAPAQAPAQAQAAAEAPTAPIPPKAKAQNGAKSAKA